MPESPLAYSDNLIIFTTAPTGLGHLRVTKAIKDGLPDSIHSFILGATDKTLTYLHRLGSINPVLRQVQYLVQYQPFAEHIFTANYRNYLRTNAEEIFYQLETVISSHQPKIRNAVIVATHFSLAHQIAAIKDELQQKTGVRIKLFVIVTDDTFQSIWAVDGADFLFVPSEIIKRKYSRYFTSNKLPKPTIVTNPYPVSPFLAEKEEKFLKDRKAQLDPNSTVPTHIVTPISGAAVQLEYLQSILQNLVTDTSKPFSVTIVCKKAPFTTSFLHISKMLPHVTTLSCTTNEETIRWYDEVFAKTPIPSLEITKPSEQAFKALLSPRQRGGIIFLFTDPVGRQEVDNIKFLTRNHLLPTSTERSHLLSCFSSNTSVPVRLMKKVRKWRGLILPSSPHQAAKFITYCRREQVFSAMLAYEPGKALKNYDQGVPLLWQFVEKELAKL